MTHAPSVRILVRLLIATPFVAIAHDFVGQEFNLMVLLVGAVFGLIFWGLALAIYVLADRVRERRGPLWPVPLASGFAGVLALDSLWSLFTSFTALAVTVRALVAGTFAEQGVDPEDPWYWIELALAVGYAVVLGALAVAAARVVWWSAREWRERRREEQERLDADLD